jgi:pimeloyl-ACP methyl ester carboxylesterase
VALLDFYGYQDSIFMGHDWGSTVVWGLTLLHPDRVKKIINLSVPYLERGDRPWIDFLTEFLGTDNYMVHFNQKPGVADAVFNEHTHQFLRNLFRKNVPFSEPEPGMSLINLARQEALVGDPIMGEEDLQVFVSSFKTSGFTPSLNWYRNLDRNWHLLGTVDPIIKQPALMIYGDKDPVLQFDRLADYVPNVDVVTLDCGHWIQEEKADEVNEVVLEWLRG